MINCPACSKQNQAHYRFCLGCGSELPRHAAGESPANAAAAGAAGGAGASDETELGGAAAVVAQSAPAEAAEAPAPAAIPAGLADEGALQANGPDSDSGTGPITHRNSAAQPDAGLPPGMCGECNAVNPPTNRFCATCGAPLGKSAPQPRPDSPAVNAGSATGSGAILVALDPEGTEVGRYELPVGATTVGRDLGGIFAADDFLSPEHAVVTAEGGTVTIRDQDSLNGVFRKLLAEQPCPIGSGQHFRIGQELLRFEAIAPAAAVPDSVLAQGGHEKDIIGTVSLVVGRKSVRPRLTVSRRGINFGRERGDVLFSEDGYVSGLHCNLSLKDDVLYVTDLGSSNGTFVQVVEEVTLSNGDVLLMGQQLFRVTI